MEIRLLLFLHCQLMINLYQTLWKKLISLMIFNRQFQPMSNDSTLPLTVSFETTNHLSSFNIRKEKVSKIIQTLDHNKAHRPDGIYNTFIEMCGSSIIKELQLLFNNCVKQGDFPDIWKMEMENLLTIIDLHLYYQFAQI